jgi:hypothetical protein
MSKEGVEKSGKDHDHPLLHPSRKLNGVHLEDFKGKLHELEPSAQFRKHLPQLQSARS